MYKKITLIMASVAVIAVAVSTLLVLANQNPKIYCQADEQGTSNWYRARYSPILSSGDYGGKNFSSLQHVNLGIMIFNNNTISLFNIAIEVTYRTIEDKWNTVTKTNIGFIDIQQSKKYKN